MSSVNGVGNPSSPRQLLSPTGPSGRIGPHSLTELNSPRTGSSVSQVNAVTASALISPAGNLSSENKSFFKRAWSAIVGAPAKVQKFIQVAEQTRDALPEITQKTNEAMKNGAEASKNTIEMVKNFANLAHEGKTTINQVNEISKRIGRAFETLCWGGTSIIGLGLYWHAERNSAHNNTVGKIQKAVGFILTVGAGLGYIKRLGNGILWGFSGPRLTLNLQVKAEDEPQLNAPPNSPNTSPRSVSSPAATSRTPVLISSPSSPSKSHLSKPKFPLESNPYDEFSELCSNRDLTQFDVDNFKNHAFSEHEKYAESLFQALQVLNDPECQIENKSTVLQTFINNIKKLLNVLEKRGPELRNLALALRFLEVRAAITSQTTI